jgi:hypothetical protein
MLKDNTLGAARVLKNSQGKAYSGQTAMKHEAHKKMRTVSFQKPYYVPIRKLKS